MRKSIWIQRATSYLLALLLLQMILPATVLAEGEMTSAEGITYRLEDDGAIITAMESGEKRVILPELVDGHPVVGLYHLLKNVDGVEEVVVPSSVKRIRQNAFSRCKDLKSIELSEGLESIERHAFLSLPQLKKIVIPASVKEIAPGAFDSCSALTVIEIVEGNGKYYSEKGVLFSKEGERIGLHTYPLGKKDKTYQIPKGVTTIEERAFEGNEILSAVKFPESLESIEAYAFYKCRKISSVTLPKSLQTIELNAFSLAEIKKYQVSKGNPSFQAVKGVLFSADGSKLILYPRNSEAKEYKVPDGVRVIGAEAFALAFYLQRVTLPTGLETIEAGAFRYAKFPGIKLPDTLMEIGDNAFMKSELKIIVIPDSVSKIGKEAFSNCADLVEATLSAGLKDLPDSLFFDCKALEKVIIQEGTTALSGFSIFSGCENLTLFIPNSLVSIDQLAILDLYSIGPKVDWLTVVGPEDSPVREMIEELGYAYKVGTPETYKP